MSCKRCGYSGAGHPCPVCWPRVTASVTGKPPVTARVAGFVSKRKPRSDKVYDSDAARQRAYRERGK